MEKYIKYKRFVYNVNGDEEIQSVLDELSSGGWNIVNYNEKLKDVTTITLTIIGGKKQSTIL